MGEPGSRNRTIGDVAKDIDALFAGVVAMPALEWHLEVLSEAEDVNQVLEVKADEFLAADLARYVLAALPRAFTLKDEEKMNRADALRAELRAYVGGCL